MQTAENILLCLLELMDDNSIQFDHLLTQVNRKIDFLIVAEELLSLVLYVA